MHCACNEIWQHGINDRLLKLSQISNVNTHRPSDKINLFTAQLLQRVRIARNADRCDSQTISVHFCLSVRLSVRQVLMFCADE